MRPHRLELTNQLVLSYGLHEHMTMHAPRKATEEELREFHNADYIDFLKRYVPHYILFPNSVSQERRSVSLSRYHMPMLLTYPHTATD